MEKKHKFSRFFCIPLAALVLFCAFVAFIPEQEAHAEAIPNFADYSPIVDPLFYILVDGVYYSFKLPLLSTFEIDSSTGIARSIVRDITNNIVIGGWEYYFDTRISSTTMPTNAYLTFQSIIGNIETMYILTDIRLFDDWGVLAADLDPRVYWNFTCPSFFETSTYFKWVYFQDRRTGDTVYMEPTSMDNYFDAAYNEGVNFRLATNMAGVLTFNEYSECLIIPYDEITFFDFDIPVIATQLLGTLNTDYYNDLAYIFELVENTTVIETELPQNWLDWLGVVLDGFFGMEIFPNFTLGMVFIAVIAIMFVFFVIKMIK